MADFLDNYDDIVFLDSEIEDDDENAPVGELIEVVDGKVRIADKPAPVQASVSAAEEAPADAAAPVESVQSAEETAPVAEEPAKEEELPAPDPIYLYPYGMAPAAAQESAPATEETTQEQPASEEVAPVPEPALASAQPEEEPLPAPAQVEETVSEPAPEQTAAAGETPAKKPAKKKAAKPVSHTIIQSASDDGNVWGNAVIAPKKKEAKKEEEPQADEKATQEAAADTAPVTEKKKSAPRKKAAPAQTEADASTAQESVPAAEKKQPAAKKKPAAKDNKENTDTQPVKEETQVAKTKAASDDAKKETQKTAKKETAKPEAKKAPAKADAKKPAPAKAAAKPAKEETKKPESQEQVIEAGDASAPHGKFVIKKTDKGNFVYKLYSSNYRVVAIGAGLYTSIASCKTGINSVRNNAESAPIEDQTLQKWEELKFPKWQIYTDKQGEIRLRLLASNGNIVATTNDGYLSKEAAKKGIAAIARAAKGAEIVRNDDLW